MSEKERKPQKRNEQPQPIFFAKKEFDGMNSEIREHHYPDGKRLVVTRLGARKGGFSFEEAHEIVQNALQYQKELEECGVPLPAIENIVVEYEPMINRSVVVKSSPWVGHEVKKMIEECDYKSDCTRIDELVAQMIDITKKIAHKRHDGYELSVGIDPQASNYIIDDEGIVRYVDLFPTRIRKDGSPIVEWPAPQTDLGHDLGHFKHFDLRGIMLTKTAQLARLKPELKERFEKTVFDSFKEVLTGEEHTAFLSELEKTPWMRVRTHLKNKDQESLMKEIDTALDARPFGIDYNVYTLREIALELAYAGLIDKETLATFFSHTHFEDELPREHLEEALKILRDAVTTL